MVMLVTLFIQSKHKFLLLYVFCIFLLNSRAIVSSQGETIFLTLNMYSTTISIAMFASQLGETFLENSFGDFQTLFEVKRDSDRDRQRLIHTHTLLFVYTLTLTYTHMLRLHVDEGQ